jgi:hypothetical protein
VSLRKLAGYILSVLFIRAFIKALVYLVDLIFCFKKWLDILSVLVFGLECNLVLIPLMVKNELGVGCFFTF